MKPIKVTKKSLASHAANKIGKKRAKKLVYGFNLYGHERKLLMRTVGDSRNLKDIRLLHFFACPLSCFQKVILENNGGYYSIVRNA